MDYLKFTPIKVEGLDNVLSISLHKDKIEFECKNQNQIFYYQDIAKNNKYKWVKSIQIFFGFSVNLPLLAYRDMSEHSFLFFIKNNTNKEGIKIFISNEDMKQEKGFAESLFFRIRKFIYQVGFETFDIS